MNLEDYTNEIKAICYSGGYEPQLRKKRDEDILDKEIITREQHEKIMKDVGKSIDKKINSCEGGQK